jgi:hypothetical protein
LALARSHRMTAGVSGRLRRSLKVPVDIQEVLLASYTKIIEMSGRPATFF